MSTVTEGLRKFVLHCNNYVCTPLRYPSHCPQRSLVAFAPKRRLMGHSAKNQHVLNFKNTVYGFKNLLGRKFSDPYVQQEMKSLPFSIVAQRDDALGIKVMAHWITYLGL